MQSRAFCGQPGVWERKIYYWSNFHSFPCYPMVLARFQPSTDSVKNKKLTKRSKKKSLPGCADKNIILLRPVETEIWKKRSNLRLRHCNPTVEICAMVNKTMDGHSTKHFL
jgi:hypothetical protein